MRGVLTAFSLVLLVLMASGGLADAADGPPIGVLLWRGSGEVEVGTESRPLQVETGGKLLAFPAGLTTLTLEKDGARLGRTRLPRRPFRLRAEGGAPTRVFEGLYEGWIEVIPDSRGWKVVNRLPLDRYLLGVVPKEMPDNFEPAALEAQAIASRTFAIYQILSRAPNASHHVTGDTRSQVYGGLTSSATVRRAVDNTRGQVLLHDGKVFEAFFHSTCGGATFGGWEAFGAPRIEPLESVPCRTCRSSAYWRWQNTRIPATAMKSILQPDCRDQGIELGEIVSIDPIDPGPGGHAAYVRIRHAGGSFEMDAIRFRLLMLGNGYGKLRSTSFRAERAGTDFVFHGRGWGHGVGMCQIGVQGLAQEGYDAVGILQYYYRGSRVVELWR